MPENENEKPIVCLDCDWQGVKGDLVWSESTDDEYPPVAGHVCPNCNSVAWEPTS